MDCRSHFLYCFNHPLTSCIKRFRQEGYFLQNAKTRPHYKMRRPSFVRGLQHNAAATNKRWRFTGPCIMFKRERILGKRVVLWNIDFQNLWTPWHAQRYCYHWYKTAFLIQQLCKRILCSCWFVEIFICF